MDCLILPVLYNARTESCAIQMGLKKVEPKLGAGYASASQGNQVLQFFEPKFTFLECERHQNISYMDRSETDLVDKQYQACAIDVT